MRLSLSPKLTHTPPGPGSGFWPLAERPGDSLLCPSGSLWGSGLFGQIHCKGLEVRLGLMLPCEEWKGVFKGIL